LLSKGLEELVTFSMELFEMSSAFLEIEYFIADSDLNIIAGTGKYSKKKSLKIDLNTLVNVFPLNQRHESSNIFPGEVGRNSDSIEVINEEFSLWYPIMRGQDLYCFLWFRAVLEGKKLELNHKKECFRNYAVKLTKLIYEEIDSENTRCDFKYTTALFNSIVSIINYGLIFVDYDWKIRFANLRILDLPEANDENVWESVIKNEAVSRFIKRRESLDCLELQIEKDNKYFELIVSGTPVFNRGENIGYVVLLNDIKSINKLWKKFIDHGDDISFKDIIGDSRVMTAIKSYALSVSKSYSTILLQGESGTGKELFVRAIHNASNRKNGSLVYINCAATPETLIESELFGCEKEAFTRTRKRGRIGKFHIADNGTLFIDKIDDMPLHLQVKLLRAIEEKKVDKPGGDSEINVDVTIIAASKKNLEEMVGRNEFREDLYQRLKIVSIIIPPLREREPNDLIMLIDYYIRRFSWCLEKKIVRVDNDYIDEMISYNWPGNVRELKNVVEYSVNTDKDRILRKDDLPKKLIDHNNGTNIKNYFRIAKD